MRRFHAADCSSSQARRSIGDAERRSRCEGCGRRGPADSMGAFNAHGLETCCRRDPGICGHSWLSPRFARRRPAVVRATRAVPEAASEPACGADGRATRRRARALDSCRNRRSRSELPAARAGSCTGARRRRGTACHGDSRRHRQRRRSSDGRGRIQRLDDHRRHRRERRALRSVAARARRAEERRRVGASHRSDDRGRGREGARRGARARRAPSSPRRKRRSSTRSSRR